MKYIFALLTLIATPAIAQQNCAPHATAVQQLWTQYSETLQYEGVASNGVLIQTFASSATGSWSIVAVNPEGLACMVASGDAFEVVNAPGGDPA